MKEEMLRFAEYCSQIDYIFTSCGMYWFCDNDKRPDRTTKELYQMFKTKNKP